MNCWNLWKLRAWSRFHLQLLSVDWRTGSVRTHTDVSVKSVSTVIRRPFFDSLY